MRAGSVEHGRCNSVEGVRVCRCAGQFLLGLRYSPGFRCQAAKSQARCPNSSGGYVYDCGNGYKSESVRRPIANLSVYLYAGWRWRERNGSDDLARLERRLDLRRVSRKAMEL